MEWTMPSELPALTSLNTGEQCSTSTAATPEIFNALTDAVIFITGEM